MFKREDLLKNEEIAKEVREVLEKAKQILIEKYQPLKDNDRVGYDITEGWTYQGPMEEGQTEEQALQEYRRACEEARDRYDFRVVLFGNCISEIENAILGTYPDKPKEKMDEMDDSWLNEE